jgi:3-oxoacyl-[acyl-carrier protein] reductase
VRADLGPIRYLVSCTGLAQQAAFHRLTEPEIRTLVDVNLLGTIAIARAVVTPMMKSGAGRIVLVGSVSGGRGIAGHTVYAATKAAVEGLTRALAREAGPFGVTVNCVAPGLVATAMTDGMPAKTREDWLRRIALGRPARPEEIAAVVAFLLAGESAYVTGQTVVVDGGISL